MFLYSYNRTALLSMPTEVIARIASYRSARELAPTLAVCKAWFNILTTSPQLWTKLYILCDVDRQAPAFHKLIKYSGSSPLELTLYGLVTSSHGYVSRLIRAAMHRITFLEVWFDFKTESDNYNYFDAKFLDDLCSVPAPALRLLSLGYSGSRPAQQLVIPTDLFEGSAPQLVVLNLDTGITLDITQPTPAFANVNTISACPELLNLAISRHLLPMLKSLHFCGLYDPDSDAVPPNARWHGFSLHLPRLREVAGSYSTRILSRAGSAMQLRLILQRTPAAHEILTPSLSRPVFLSMLFSGVANGQFVAHFTTTAGRAVGIEWGRVLGPDPLTAQVSVLSKVLGRSSIFASLRALALSDNLFSSIHSEFGTIHMPSLLILFIRVTPLSVQEHPEDSSLQDFNQLHNGPLLRAERLAILRLVTYSTVPSAARRMRDARLFCEPASEPAALANVSAASLAHFIRHGLNFIESPLLYLIMDRVTFSEGVRDGLEVLGESTQRVLWT